MGGCRELRRAVAIQQFWSLRRLEEGVRLRGTGRHGVHGESPWVSIRVYTIQLRESKSHRDRWKPVLDRLADVG